jgi:hypothetical protein
MTHVLVLNAAYQPISVIPWKEAVTLWFSEKAEVLETYADKVLHAGNSFVKSKLQGINANWDENSETWAHWMNAPCVIRLYEFVKPHKELKFYKSFTRKNIWDRDGKKCAYCGEHITLKEVTYDHIVPQSAPYNGPTCWSNIVCSCFECNSKKNNRTPREANMKLLVKPHAPIIADNYTDAMIRKLKDVPKILNNEQWASYIYFRIELDKDDEE